MKNEDANVAFYPTRDEAEAHKPEGNDWYTEPLYGLGWAVLKADAR